VPLEVSRPYSGLGDRDSVGLLTWNVYPADGSRFTLHHSDHTSTTLRVQQLQNGWSISLEGTPQAHLLRLHSPKEPEKVERDGMPMAKGTDWRYDAAARRLWVRATQPVGGRYEIH
jgi:hypothetical protein